METVNKIIYPDEKKKVGRPANPVKYSHISYNGNNYTIMTIQHKEYYIKAVIDKEDFPKVKDYSWCLTSNSYIGSTVVVDSKRIVLYLHNIVMNRLEHTGKGSTITVDHINRNGLDNRKKNLRLATQTEQNLNQKRKGRTIELPSDSGIKSEDIPKHIWYIKPNGEHGDRFGIDLKTEGIKWKTTSSRKISLVDKLHLAIEQLEKYYGLYPHLNPNNDDKTLEMKSLAREYEEIIKLDGNIEECKSVPLYLPKEDMTVDIVPIVDVCESKYPSTPDISTNKSTTNDVLYPQTVIVSEPVQERKGCVKDELPKQWKSKQIYKTIQANEENDYKTFCEENNTVQSDWMEQWSAFILSVKGKAFSESEPLIKAFVENLRRIRHNQLCAKPNLIERDDRLIWPSHMVVRAFLEGKLDAFKTFTEASTNESPENPKWTKRWNEFVKSLETHPKDELQQVCSKFMTAQRTKKYRKSKM